MLVDPDGNLCARGLLFAKGIAFVILGGLAGTLLLAGHPDPWAPLLLALTVWAFARAYYFAFYVIEHYIDPTYRFRGLIDCASYLLRRAPPERTGPGG